MTQYQRVMSVLSEWFVYLVLFEGWIYPFHGLIFGIFGKRTKTRLTRLKTEIASRSSDE